ncbi:uncharacterized protein EKO05_0004139 [Ascochyta rabiei]|uniref:Uncharacterized protein n=1 Tax=Didymella rabiei TaxID=5454 RepID=A0A162Y047_DIDRA|nr:uncharacterized protein EKO05_0004139 [Ascochyta rabiei]KZM19766.1 hypothetical protein ST47_g9177 [Ascochyta rabiei]UPX13638.1 hypothetical protein EKO05_0004139 [Ascochyta rabiei]
MASEDTNTIDATPISPVRSKERRGSLEKHLQHRPEAQDLKNRHILLDTTTAPALQARALELERQRATDNLRKGLNARPEREDLIQRNILLSSNAAPALQEKQRELEHHMKADSLEKGLQSRPNPEELVKKGILEADENPLKGV